MSSKVLQRCSHEMASGNRLSVWRATTSSVGTLTLSQSRDKELKELTYTALEQPFSEIPGKSQLHEK